MSDNLTKLGQAKTKTTSLTMETTLVRIFALKIQIDNQARLHVSPDYLPALPRQNEVTGIRNDVNKSRHENSVFDMFTYLLHVLKMSGLSAFEEIDPSSARSVLSVWSTAREGLG